MNEELKKLLDSKIFLYSLILICSFLFLAFTIDSYNALTYEDPLNQEIVFDTGYYYGPVPLGYNETHFRLAGETIKNGDWK